VNDALCTNDPSLVSAAGQCLIASSALRSRLGFTGKVRETLNFPNHTGGFAPRLGLAWRPFKSDKLVIRAGGGIFADLPDMTMYGGNTLDNPIVSRTSTYNTAFGFPPPLTNGQPTTAGNVFFSAAVPILSQGVANYPAEAVFKLPRLYEWSFGIQSQLSTNWALDVSYIANKGQWLDNQHLWANQPEPGVGDLAPRRPYPDFNIMRWDTTDATSSYNSLQVKLTKRFFQGLSFLAGYTYAKGLQNNGGDDNGDVPQDDNSLAANYGPVTWDVRHRVVLSPIWELPVGNGKRFLNRSGVLDDILGHWRFSTIVTLQSGMPFTVYSNQDYSNTASTSPRPDRVCNGTGPQTVNEWFNVNCFTIAALEQALASGNPRFGNSGTEILIGPRFNNWDMALIKRVVITERLKLEFRGEFFNTFNTPHFRQPNSAKGTTNFGAIGGAGESRDMQFGLKLTF